MKIKLREATEEPKITAYSIAQFEADRLKGEAKEIDDSHAAVEFKFRNKYYNVDIRLKELGDLTETNYLKKYYDKLETMTDKELYNAWLEVKDAPDETGTSEEIEYTMASDALWEIEGELTRRGFMDEDSNKTEKWKELTESNLEEAIEQKYEKSNPDFNRFLKDVKQYTGSYDYLFGGKVSTECDGDPITVNYFYYERPYVGGGYNLVTNVLTPLGKDGGYIQDTIDKAFEKNSKTKLSNREIKDKILQAVSSLNKDFNESASNFQEIATKSVKDSDGFTTDYTLYKDLANNKFVCVFGDKGLYKPEDSDYDFETDYEDEAKEWFNLYAGFDEAEGTQVDDIAKKEDYPQFKLGKRITNLVEDEVLNNLEPEEKQRAAEIYNERIIKGYKCKNCKRTIPNITFFDKKVYKDDSLEYSCPFCNEPYEPEDLQNIEIKESYNYIGQDTGKEGIHKNTHIETIYTLYDKYGEIGEYKTYEEAKKDMDEWYNDPELYPDGEMGLHIEGPEEIEVSNNKIIVKDDLS